MALALVGVGCGLLWIVFGLGGVCFGVDCVGFGFGLGWLGAALVLTLGWHWSGQAHTRPKPGQAKGKPSQARQTIQISRKYPPPFAHQFACKFVVKKCNFLQFGTNCSKSDAGPAAWPAQSMRICTGPAHPRYRMYAYFLCSCASAV